MLRDPAEVLPKRARPPLAPKFRGDVEELWMWRAVIITLNPIFISSFTASTAFLLNCSLMTPTA